MVVRARPMFPRRPVPTQLTRTLAVALAAPLAGCGAELDVWTGAHVDYLSSTSLTACQGTRGYVDNFVPFLSSELGIEKPGRLQYQWLDEDDFSDAPCRDTISGCARKSTAYAKKPALLHELTHTVTSSAGMNGHLFFTEGLAVTYDPWLGDGLGPRYTVSVRPEDPLPDPRIEIDASADDLDYALAGSFVSFLLSRHGPQKFVSLSQQLGEDTDLSAIGASFKDIYGLDFDAEVEVFRAGVPCGDSPHAVRVYDCAAPEVAWDNNVWSIAAGMDCSDDAVVGEDGADPATPRIHSVTFQIPVTGQYTLSVEASEGTAVQTGPCFGCPWVPGEVGIAASGTVTAEFAAGSHYLRIRSEASDSSTVRAALRPAL